MASPQRPNIIQNFELQLGKPVPKLLLKFSQLSKKWDVAEPYKTSLQKRPENQRKQSQSTMILTDEDTRNIRQIEDQSKELDKQIEHKRDAKAMKECQANLLKLQLAQLMQELNKRIAALDKSGSNSSPAKGASQDLEDDKVVSPQRMTQSSARNLSKSNLEEDKEIEEELAVQRI